MIAAADVFPSEPPVLPGRGWLEPGSVNGARFRDVLPDATLRVALVTAREHRIFVDVEPAAQTEPLLLEVLAEGEPPVRFALHARGTILFALRPAHPRVAQIALRARRGGAAANGVPAPAYRVFRVWLHVLPPDVGGFDFRPGPGWCLREQHAAESFRWAGNEVVLERTSVAANVLHLDVEPGPAAGPLPLALTAFAGDESTLGTYEIGSRQRIAIPLPDREPPVWRVILRTEHPGRPMAGDARVLSYRAFGSARER